MKQNARKLEGEFDYIIVGAGTAGCVLANRLTEDPDVTVLLLEAGGKDDYHWIHVPVGYLYCIGNPRTDWLYKTQAEPGLNGRALSYPRGRVLGGCSSINGMIYMRGQREDYDDWAQVTGDPNWSWDSVLPVFRRSEDHHGGAQRMARRGRRMARRKAAPEVEDPRNVLAGGAANRHSAPPTISIAATTPASAISTSTRRAAFAGTRRKRSCAPR